MAGLTLRKDRQDYSICSREAVEYEFPISFPLPPRLPHHGNVWIFPSRVMARACPWPAVRAASDKVLGFLRDHFSELPKKTHNPSDSGSPRESALSSFSHFTAQNEGQRGVAGLFQPVWPAPPEIGSRVRGAPEERLRRDAGLTCPLLKIVIPAAQTPGKPSSVGSDWAETCCLLGALLPLKAWDGPLDPKPGDPAWPPATTYTLRSQSD